MLHPGSMQLEAWPGYYGQRANKERIKMILQFWIKMILQFWRDAVKFNRILSKMEIIVGMSKKETIRITKMKRREIGNRFRKE